MKAKIKNPHLCMICKKVIKPRKGRTVSKRTLRRYGIKMSYSVKYDILQSKLHRNTFVHDSCFKKLRKKNNRNLFLPQCFGSEQYNPRQRICWGCDYRTECGRANKR